MKGKEVIPWESCYKWSHLDEIKTQRSTTKGTVFNIKEEKKIQTKKQIFLR